MKPELFDLVQSCTYKDAYDLKRAIEEQCEMMDVLCENGIPERDVHHFKKPSVSSGYSMGEFVITKCRDEVICRVDNTDEYAKSCKWKANHGVVFVVFNKKQLREYVELLKRGDTINAYNLAVSCVDVGQSKITKKQLKQWETN